MQRVSCELDDRSTFYDIFRSFFFFFFLGGGGGGGGGEGKVITVEFQWLEN